MIRLRPLIAAIVMAGGVAACQKRLDLSQYTSSEQVYRAGLAALEEGRARAAITAFEHLTFQLGPRDTLLPRSYWYLGVANMKAKEWAAANSAFRKIHALFEGDSLADDGLLAAARASRRMWANPERYGEYGEDAKSLLGTLIQSYPATSLRDTVFRELDELDNMFAIKDYEVALDYFKRGVWESAIIYARDVNARFPATPTARKARMLMVRVYRKRKWNTEADDECKIMREMYRNDREVLELCGPGVPVVAAPVPP